MQPELIKILKCLNCGKPLQKTNYQFCNNDCVRQFQNNNWNSSYIKKGESKMPNK